MTTWRLIVLPPHELLNEYHVSDQGQVRIGDAGQPLYTEPSDSGYHRVRLVRRDGTRNWYRVHLLVLEAFVGPRPAPRYHGAHNNGDKNNNTLLNLSWKTPEGNEADKKLHGTATGGKAGVRPLPAQEIKDLRAQGHSLTQIAKSLDAHRSSVARIVKEERQGLRIRFKALTVGGRPRYLCVNCTSGWVGVKFNPEGAYGHALAHVRRGDTISAADMTRLQKHALSEETARAEQAGT